MDNRAGRKAMAKAERILAQAYRERLHVDTLDGTLCVVCAESKGWDEPETIVKAVASAFCYNCGSDADHVVCHCCKNRP